MSIKEKCESCPLRTIDKYDGWCYFDNKWYEAILKEVDEKWYIPKEFIYGFIDKSGNLHLNNNYLFTDYYFISVGINTNGVNIDADYGQG